MKCPIDGSDLVMAERQGIEIDYCPKCRGVWLDRGELDKIIDRAAETAPQQPAFAPSQQPAPAPYSERQYDPAATTTTTIISIVITAIESGRAFSASFSTSTEAAGCHRQVEKLAL